MDLVPPTRSFSPEFSNKHEPKFVPTDPGGFRTDFDAAFRHIPAVKVNPIAALLHQFKIVQNPSVIGEAILGHDRGGFVLSRAA